MPFGTALDYRTWQEVLRNATGDISGLGKITGQCLKGGRGERQKAVFLFSFETDLPEGEGPAADRNFRRQRSAAGLHASRDSLYRTG